jgi:hypothetical protein
VEAETIGLPFARSVVVVERTSTPTRPGAEPQTGTRYYVTSLASPAPGSGQSARAVAAVAKLSRGHWSIENKNHWKKDSVWGDDTPRQRSPVLARTLSLLRGALLAQVSEPLPGLFARCRKSAGAALAIVKSTLQPLK